MNEVVNSAISSVLAKANNRFPAFKFCIAFCNISYFTTLSNGLPVEQIKLTPLKYNALQTTLIITQLSISPLVRQLQDYHYKWRH